MIPWSVSRLKNFQMCPAKFKYLYVTKEVKDSMDPTGIEGINQHKALEMYIKQDSPLPEKLAKFTPILDRFKKLNPQTEYEFALTQDYEFVDWWHPLVWFRCKSDLLITNSDSVLYIDYKTGKVKTDKQQSLLTAICIFLKWPHITTVKTRNWWLKVNLMEGEEYTRSNLNLYLDEMEKLYAPINEAERTGNFPYKPSKGICGFCPAKAKCPVAVV